MLFAPFLGEDRSFAPAAPERKIKILTVILLALATVLGASAQTSLPQAQAPPPPLAIEEVAIVDVLRGEIVGPRTVLVVDGRIAAIGTSKTIAIPAAARRVDGRGRYLMPGLIDMHVHLFNNATHRPPNEWAFPLFVANGVTGVREMACAAGDLPTLRAWQEARAEGRLIAPRVLAAGLAVGHNAETSVREQVIKAHAAGADFIKVFSDLPAPEWRAVMDEARALGIPVCGHIPREVKLLEAAAAGQRSDEHLTQVYEACSTHEALFLEARKGLSRQESDSTESAQESEVLESFDPQLCTRMAAALALTKQVQVPTLVLRYFEANGSPTNFRENPSWRHLRRDEQSRWERILKERHVETKLASRRCEISRRIVQQLNVAGVRILAGTDTPMPLVYPGLSLHKELELLVEAGLSPVDALRAATIWPAEFLDLAASAGSITVGKRADLLLLDGNPLREITNTQRLRAVVLDGRLLPRSDLQALLDQAPKSPPRAVAPFSPTPVRQLVRKETHV